MWWVIPAAVGLMSLFSVHAKPIAPTGQVVGRVIDAKTGESIAFAHVYVVGTTLGGKTDSAGNYQIEYVPVGFQTVRVSSVEIPTPVETEIIVFNQSTTAQNFELQNRIVCRVCAKREIFDKFGGGWATSRIYESTPPPNLIPVDDPPLRIAVTFDLPTYEDILAANGAGRLTHISVMLDSYEAFDPTNGRRASLPEDYDVYHSDPEIGPAPRIDHPRQSNLPIIDPSFPTPVWAETCFWELPMIRSSL